MGLVRGEPFVARYDPWRFYSARRHDDVSPSCRLKRAVLVARRVRTSLKTRPAMPPTRRFLPASVAIDYALKARTWEMLVIRHGSRISSSPVESKQVRLHSEFSFWQACLTIDVPRY